MIKRLIDTLARVPAVFAVWGAYFAHRPHGGTRHFSPLQATARQREKEHCGRVTFQRRVDVVVFATLYRIVLGDPESIGAGGIAWLLVEETGGGVLFGLVLGYGLYRLLRSINHYQTEVILTLSAVRGGYLLAQCLHVSGPLAMVVAGIGRRPRPRRCHESPDGGIRG